jgi:hypothetical protein
LHSEKGKLEVKIHTCDSAHRAGNKHLLNLRESQTQSKELQGKMRMDMRGLEDHLAAAKEQVEAQTFCTSKMQETNATTLTKKKRNLFETKSKLAAATKELGASKVRERYDISHQTKRLGLKGPAYSRW